MEFAEQFGKQTEVENKHASLNLLELASTGESKVARAANPSIAKEQERVVQLFNHGANEEYLAKGVQALSTDLQGLSKNIKDYNKLLKGVSDNIPDEPVSNPSISMDKFNSKTGTWDRVVVGAYVIDEGHTKAAYRIVSPGNTLSGIAKEMKDLVPSASSVSNEEYMNYLQKLNNIPEVDKIKVGQAIKLQDENLNPADVQREVNQSAAAVESTILKSSTVQEAASNAALGEALVQAKKAGELDAVVRKVNADLSRSHEGKTYSLFAMDNGNDVFAIVASYEKWDQKNVPVSDFSFGPRLNNAEMEKAAAQIAEHVFKNQALPSDPGLLSIFGRAQQNKQLKELVQKLNEDGFGDADFGLHWNVSTEQAGKDRRGRPVQQLTLHRQLNAAGDFQVNN